MDENEIRKQINRFLVKEKIKREEFCYRAGISAATLNKCMTGKMRFSEKTVSKIIATIGIPDSHISDEVESFKNYGGYSKIQANKYIGSYLTFRPSFSEAKSIFAYITDISWSDERGALEFNERNRHDPEHCQHGYISIPQETNFIYFIVNYLGQYRMSVCRRNAISGEIYGLINTLKIVDSWALVPVTTFIHMIPYDSCELKTTGIIRMNDKNYQFFMKRLERTQSKKLAELLLV